MDLRKKLATLMAEKKITVRDIEERSEIPQKSIVSILNGYSKNPTAKTLKAIAQALDVSLEYIISEDAMHLNVLNKHELVLYKKCCIALVDAVIEKQYEINLDKLNTIVKEIYDYSSGLYNSSDSYSIDRNFVDWILKKNKNY